jgi:hypothetical protein
MPIPKNEPPSLAAMVVVTLTVGMILIWAVSWFLRWLVE